MEQVRSDMAGTAFIVYDNGGNPEKKVLHA
jgi:hypothetical protein